MPYCILLFVVSVADDESFLLISPPKHPPSQKITLMGTTATQ